VAVYIPVHLDIRYLVPLIPLQCLLAATLWGAFGTNAAPRSEGRRADSQRERDDTLAHLIPR